MDPVAEQLHEERKERLRLRASSREFAVAAGATGVFLALATALAIAGTPLSADLVAFGCVIAAYAALWQVEFEVGPISTSPVQAAAVPLWFVVDPAALPLVVAGVHVVAHGLRCLRTHAGSAKTARAMMYAIPDAFFAFGPAAVLLAFGSGAPEMSQLWVYALAIAAQFGADAFAVSVRSALSRRSTVPLGDWRWLWSIDAALLPLGLAVALATTASPWAPLTLVPLAVILAQFAKERDERIQQAVELSSAYRGTARLMGDVLEADDAYTGGEHTQGVVGLALELGRAMKLDPREMRDLEFGAMLHDIGKLRVPNEIINKPGKLTDDEWAVIKQHPGYGQEMLDRVGGELSHAGVIVRAHHERWDGGGYPDGLTGEEIPIQARIITICDSFSAMTTDRSYRKGMSVEDALDELDRCAGTQFDPVLIKHAREILLASLPATAPAAKLRVLAEPAVAVTTPHAA